MTRLSRIHPYPAMMADSLAVALCQRIVSRHSRVIDPFCGTARTLFAAAAVGASSVGVDTNPLALLIARAKEYRGRCRGLRRLLNDLPSHAVGHRPIGMELQPGRSVAYFGRRVEDGLASLIGAVNSAALSRGETAVAATVLSASAREASYCRLDQWKLHRLSVADRRYRARADVIRIFRRRLINALRELRSPFTAPPSRVIQGDARCLVSELERSGHLHYFDHLITSPPYGDSRTTVQYGGMASLLLGVLRHINGAGLAWAPTGTIDNACLGGSTPGGDSQALAASYWVSSHDTSATKRVGSFLSDMLHVVDQISAVMRQRGTATFVVARRRVLGRPVMLDVFLEDAFRAHGWSLAWRDTRRIAGKLTPSRVDVRGRSPGRALRRPTMREEIVVHFVKTRRRASVMRS